MPQSQHSWQTTSWAASVLRIARASLRHAGERTAGQGAGRAPLSSKSRVRFHHRASCGGGCLGERSAEQQEFVENLCGVSPKRLAQSLAKSFFQMVSMSGKEIIRHMD